MLISNLYEKYLESRKVSTDTRQITPGSIFFALKGERFDANAFAAEALAKGAMLAVIDNEAFAKDDRYVVVPDTLKTLQELARIHRDHLTIPVIGLTGSNGKTTSKELLHAVLSTQFKTLATKGNLNNHIGVPLTILSIDPTVEIAVIEMGANHVGEIALLSSIANPTHGFITNIGKAHIGTFGGFENIIRGKTELYQHLLANDGVIFINSQNSILAPMAKQFKAPVFYPGINDYYHCELVDASPFVAVRAASGETITTQLTGSYNFENIAAALCIGKYFGIEEAHAHTAIQHYTPGNMRSQILVKGSNTIILDAYNANPSSMLVAIDNLDTQRADAKIVILGDMFELGEETEAEHRTIVERVKTSTVQQAYFCGHHFYEVKDVFPNGRFYQTKDSLMEALRENSLTNATILVKASRGIGLETIVEVL